MHIIVTCPSCNKKYRLNPDLRGKRIRCPNPACREIVDVKETEESEDLSGYEGTGLLPDDIDIVPIPEEKKYVPPKKTGMGSYGTPVAEMVPILPTEPETPSREPPTSRYQPPHQKLNLEDLIKLEVPDYSPPSSKPKPPPSRQDKGKKKRRHRDYPVAQPAAAPPSPSRAEPTSPPPRPAPVASTPIIPAATEVRSWQDAPPPVRESKGERDTLIIDRKEFFAPAAEVAAADLFEGAQPVAETPPSEQASPYQTGGTYEGEETYQYPESSGRRRARWMILTMFILVAGLVGAGGWIVYSAVAATEEKRAQQARQDYEGGNYAAAASHYEALRKDFPKSDNFALYEFLSELSDVRNQVHQTGSDPLNAAEQLSAFTKGRAGDPFLQDYAKDLWETYRKSIEDLTALSQQNLPDHFDDARQMLAAARKASGEAKTFAAKSGSHEETNQKLLARFDELERNITKYEHRAQAVAKIKTLQPTPEDIWEAESLIRKFKLQSDKEVTNLVEQLKAKLISQVSYEPAPTVPPPKPEAENRQSGLLVVPRAGPSTAPPPTGGGVVLALAQGVLYALAESDGKVLWATRVSIDTCDVPVRVPASEFGPEIALVPSSETNILTARDVVSGQPLWRYDLNAACRGRPVIVGRRAYVPTLDGKIHEIELVDGHLLGWYKLGLPLTVGGARAEGSNLVYFPADSLNVYVLDISQQKCVGILQSGHPSGSVRSAPILIGGRDSPEPKYLVLSQADGLTAMKLRAFPLPIEGISTVSVLQPELRIRGWSWFQPHYDGEKIVFSTDAGAIGLFGVQQPGNEDQPIFQELQKDASLGERSSLPSRSQVVWVSDDDFWVEANGNLQLMHFDLFGQRIVPLWNRPLPLGTPLHAAQVDEKSKTIFMVTQSLTRQACLATAVSAEDGLVRWQRQLGLNCKGDPVVLGAENLALGQGGTLFQFDSGQHPIRVATGWQTGGHIVGEPLEGGEAGPYLLSTSDGQSVFEVACVQKKTAEGERHFDLVVRHYEPGKNLTTQTFPLKTARLAGTPGLAGGNLLLLLDNGTLLRQPWDGQRGESGPGWRGRNSDPGARGHVVVLGPEEFLTTDGSRGISRWRWPAGKNYQEEKKADLPNPIAAPPVIWRGETGTEAPYVCLADTGGTVRLLRGSDLQKEVRHWELKGKITSGPFVRGKDVGCVVDQRRLIWIDPAKEKTAWEYQTPGEGIVGQPRIIGDMVVVADVTGRFAGLDPATGQARWQPDINLGASLAPTATPTEFGPDRAFVPLIDGTVFLLSLKDDKGK